MQRPKQHKLPSFMRREAHTHKGRWIQQLINKGLTYGIQVLETLDVSKASELGALERKWIAKGRESGWPLTNITDGGDGGKGNHSKRKPRPDVSAWNRTPQRQAQLRALQEARRGKPLSEATKARISAARRGKRLSPEHRVAAAAHLSRFRNRACSAETRLKLSRSRGGRPFVDTETGERFDALFQAAEQYGVKSQNVFNALNGYTKSCGGRRFEYLD